MRVTLHQQRAGHMRAESTPNQSRSIEGAHTANWSAITTQKCTPARPAMQVPGYFIKPSNSTTYGPLAPQHPTQLDNRRTGRVPVE